MTVGIYGVKGRSLDLPNLTSCNPATNPYNLRASIKSLSYHLDCFVTGMMYHLHMPKPRNCVHLSFSYREVDQLILDDPCIIVVDELQLYTTMHLHIWLSSMNLSIHHQ